MISIHRTERFSDAFRPALGCAWQSSRALLNDLGVRLDVPNDQASQALFLIPRKISDPHEGQKQFASQMSSDEEVTFIISPSRQEGAWAALAIPSTNAAPNNF